MTRTLLTPSRLAMATTLAMADMALYAELPAVAHLKGWAAKIAKAELRLDPAASGSVRLTATMRTATTDERARRSFDRYWTLGVGSGAHVLVRSLLEVVKEDAER